MGPATQEAGGGSEGKSAGVVSQVSAETGESGMQGTPVQRRVYSMGPEALRMAQYVPTAPEWLSEEASDSDQASGTQSLTSLLLSSPRKRRHASV